MGSMFGKSAALMAAVNIMIGMSAFWTVDHASKLGVFLLQATVEPVGIEGTLLKLLDYGIGFAVGVMFIFWLIRKNKELAQARDAAMDKLIEALKDQNRK